LVVSTVMLYKSFCATCIGIDAVTVTVEVDMTPGVGVHLVGLPDSAVKESLLRVFTALSSYGFRVPGRKIVVNLAPADLRKEGSSFDLAIAMGLIAVSEKIELPLLGRYILMGELALDGQLRPVTGALPAAIHAKEAGFQGCIFPKQSALEASDIDGISIYGIESLSEAIEILSATDEHSELRVVSDAPVMQRKVYANDLKHVKGQAVAKRGLEIAAAGSHNLILIGSPGSGKTMMASCLPSILPPMSKAEALETSKIYSIAGHGWEGGGLMHTRPFRAPHHSASLASLVGGGAGAKPGEISLSHGGVLYLDEIAQFPRSVLDALRQPLEDRKVVISRAKYKVEYPSNFMLIASMNPCPCGYYGDSSGRCTCSRSAIENYMSRLSGPLMDRMDLQIFCDRVSGEELLSVGENESSDTIAARVVQARQVQYNRFKNEKIFTNSQMDGELISRYCVIGDKERRYTAMVIEKLNLSARAYSRILKLSRTIADLDLSDTITLNHISEAVQYRSLDRRFDLD